MIDTDQDGRITYDEFKGAALLAMQDEAQMANNSGEVIHVLEQMSAYVRKHYVSGGRLGSSLSAAQLCKLL